jgi:hypothetical protein
MGTKSLIRKVAKFLDPPTAPRRRRRSHRLGGSTTTHRGTGTAARNGRQTGRQGGRQNGRGWRCPVCYRRTVPVCTEVSDGMPCGFCIACCPGHPDTDKARRTDARAEDGGRFRSSVQKAGE